MAHFPTIQSCLNLLFQGLCGAHLWNGGSLSQGRAARVCGVLGAGSRDSYGGPMSCTRTS